MRSKTPWVRVVIVAYNSGAFLQRCMDALERQTFAGFEAVIVDNASTDGSIDALRLPDDRFRIERAGANLGFAAGSNLGARACACAWIAMLNPDTEPHPTWLEEFRRSMERHPGVRMFGSTQIDATDPARVDGFGDVYSIFGTAWRGASGWPVSLLPDEDHEVFSPCAAGALYAREAFESAGGFDESFFCYLEDVDLGFRLRLRGERCVQVRRALLTHAGSGISGRQSDFSIWHSQRNRILVMAKDVPSPLFWLVAALQVIATPVTVLRRDPAKWGTGIKGLAAGLAALPGALRSRRKVQSERLLSGADVARLLVWDPRKALTHAPCYLDDSHAASAAR